MCALRALLRQWLVFLLHGSEMGPDADGATEFQVRGTHGFSALAQWSHSFGEELTGLLVSNTAAVKQHLFCISMCMLRVYAYVWAEHVHTFPCRY